MTQLPMSEVENIDYDGIANEILCFRTIAGCIVQNSQSGSVRVVVDRDRLEGSAHLLRIAACIVFTTPILIRGYSNIPDEILPDLVVIARK